MASGRVEQTVPFLFSMSGETLDVGVDTGSPVGPYPRRFPFSGIIERVEVEIFPDVSGAHDAEAEAERMRGALASQ